MAACVFFCLPLFLVSSFAIELESENKLRRERTLYRDVLGNGIFDDGIYIIIELYIVHIHSS